MGWVLIFVGLPGNLTFGLRDRSLGLGVVILENLVIMSVRLMCK